MRSSLQLYFVDRQLSRTAFTSADAPEPMICVRGKSTGSLRMGTFQWTEGVTAFCELALRSALWQSGCREEDPPLLEGGPGTPAASLDYALGKPPLWISDLCGVCADGSPRLKRHIHRMNPERRRAGNAVLHFRRQFLVDCRIEIYVDGVQLGRTGIQSLLRNLIGETDAPLPSLFRDQEEHRWLHSVYRSELSRAIGRTDALSPTGNRTLLRHFLKDCEGVGLSEGGERLVRLLEARPSGRHRVGVGDYHRPLQRAFDGRSLSVAIPITLVPAMMMCQRLADRCGLRLEIDYRFHHAIELVHSILGGSCEALPDAIALGCAPAALFLEQLTALDYEPLMLLPNLAHRVLRRREVDSLNAASADMMLVMSERSTSLMYFEHLSKSGALPGRRLSLVHGDQDQIFDALAHRQVDQAIAFFPDYCFNARYNDCVYVDEPGNVSEKEVILFVRRSERLGPHAFQALECGLRVYWLAFREYACEAESALTRWTSDPAYLHTLTRLSGLSIHPRSSFSSSA
ncbi:MAG: hypothetical protein IT290_05070 [Deltaproteobacteria bacterium]|nr:hypothetical protein [Deltaproteobacteria bacterium]